jgi:ssDNA-binding Zn-finger/Zn-ribbon topoisomerase 1
MVLRKSRFGDQDMFYGCSRYPTCKATIAYSEVMEALTALVEELTRKVLVYERRAQMRVVPGGPTDPKGAA